MTKKYKKKKVPYIVLKTLEPYTNKTGEYFIPDDPGDFLIRFIDKDLESDFYFNIEEFKMEGKLQLLIDRKPEHDQTTNNKRHWIEGKTLDHYFNLWTTLLKKYENIPSIFDDPYVKSFQEEYYAEFELVDEEKDKPLKSKQVLLLDEHLEYLEKGLEKYKNDENSEEISKIEANISELRNNLTKRSKEWIVSSLSRIWAEISKQGPKFIKGILTEAKKQAITQGIRLLIEQGQNLIQ